MGKQLLFSLALVSFANAGTVNLGYAVAGTGAWSEPVSGFCDSRFAWANASGGVAGSALTGYGFAPVPGSSVYETYGTGSLLLSDSFTLLDGETLSVDLTVMTAKNWNYSSMGFAVLLENSSVRAILSVTSPTGFNNYSDMVWLPYAGSSPGVARSERTGDFAAPMDLGGVVYGEKNSMADCYGACFTDVSTSITPGAGTFQLLFGAFSTREPDTALAVKSVAVKMPEPGPMWESCFLLLLVVLIVPRMRRIGTNSGSGQN